MKKEQYATEFNRILHILKGRIPDLLINGLANRFQDLWVALQSIHNIQQVPGFYYFIPVIPFSIIPAAQQMGWVEGYIARDIPVSIFQKAKTPETPYFMLGVSDGRDLVGMLRKDVPNLISNLQRSPCIDAEIAAIQLFGDLSKDLNMEALGSEYGDDKSIPFITHYGMFRVPSFDWAPQLDSISSFATPSVWKRFG